MQQRLLPASVQLHFHFSKQGLACEELPEHHLLAILFRTPTPTLANLGRGLKSHRIHPGPRDEVKARPQQPFQEGAAGILTIRQHGARNPRGRRHQFVHPLGPGTRATRAAGG